MKTLISLISNRHLDNASQHLHSHDGKRFQITALDQDYIKSAIEVAKQKLMEWRQDRGYSTTVASVRAEENAVYNFNEDLAKFERTLSQYINGEALGQYQPPSEWRNYDCSSYT